MRLANIVIIVGMFVSEIKASHDGAVNNKSGISILNENNFDKDLAKKPHLIMFYAPG